MSKISKIDSELLESIQGDSEEELPEISSSTRFSGLNVLKNNL